MGAAFLCAPEQSTLCGSGWAGTSGAPPTPQADLPGGNYNSQRPLQTAGRGHDAPAQWGRRVCGSRQFLQHPAGAEYRALWRRLTQPSFPSCLSFITGGSFPTPSTIAGSTMAEVMAAGSGWWQVGKGMWRGSGRVLSPVEMQCARHYLEPSPPRPLKCKWAERGVHDRPAATLERQGRRSYHCVAGRPSGPEPSKASSGRRVKSQRHDLRQGGRGASRKWRGTSVVAAGCTSAHRGDGGGVMYLKYPCILFLIFTFPYEMPCGNKPLQRETRSWLFFFFLFFTCSTVLGTKGLLKLPN